MCESGGGSRTAEVPLFSFLITIIMISIGGRGHVTSCSDFRAMDKPYSECEGF